METTVASTPRGPGRPAALLPLALDPGEALPLHRQLYLSLSALILEGRIAPGTRLPSSRTLARELSVSRNTVLAAFEQLTAEGYLEGRHGSGSFVAPSLAAPSARRADRPGREAAAAVAAPSRRGADLAAAAHVRGGRLRPFAVGHPAHDAFPYDAWARLSARVWRREAPGMNGPGDPAGHAGLRVAIAGYLRGLRGVVCEPAQVIVLSGAQQAVGLAARVLLDRGDAALIEEPGYPGARAALAAAGLRTVPVPVDAEGLDIAEGERRAPDARLAFIAPSHQYPLGVTMSLARRLAVLDWARRHGGWVLEDDYDSEYRYAGRPLAALQGLDEGRRTIYVGSFSKVLLPSLRLGYLVAPPALAESFRRAATVLYDQPSPVLQATLAGFFQDGGFGLHVRRMRQLYLDRQKALLAAAETHLRGLLHFAPHAAGMHLVATPAPALAARTDDAGIAAAADAAGVTLSTLERFFVGAPTARGLLFGYAAHGEPEIAAATERLGRSLRRLA